MSYSFRFRAATIAAALAFAATEIDKVVAQQPVHSHDRDVALMAVEAQASLVEAHAEGHHVVVNVSGSLGWNGSYPEDYKIASGTTNVSVFLIPQDTDDGPYGALREA